MPEINGRKYQKCEGMTIQSTNNQFLDLLKLNIVANLLLKSLCFSAGGETEGTGAVCDVSFPIKKQGVDADPNQ